MKSADMKIRVPEDLKEWLRDRAETNCRSLNGEILAMMKATKHSEAKAGSAS